jgi:aspartate ammonia-lyase
VAGLEADEERCKRHVDGATATLTALVDRIGYSAAQEIAAEAKASGNGVRTLVIERGLLTADDFDDMVCAESVTRLGSPFRKEKQHS